MTLHLLKLCVGAGSIEDLQAWIDFRAEERRARGEAPEQCHTTRMVPTRRDELLDGGSLYWGFKGLVLARQKVLRLDPVTGQDGIARCAIVLDPQVVRTRPLPRRPFQGWRYLSPEDAPEDQPEGRPAEDVLPPKLAAALAEIGVR